MIKISTLLYVWLCCKFMGKDQDGNKYYRSSDGVRTVIYNGEPEASKVPAMWHAWLHNVTDNIPDSTVKYSWQKESSKNQTGTPNAYLPTGHALAKGIRPNVTGDYEAWNPNGEKN